MKMKRSLVTMLAAVMGLSVALAGCAPDSSGGTKTVDSVKIVATKTEYVVGDTVNYADFKLTVTYSDNTTKTDLDLTSEGVTHTEISTAAAGEFDLTATYEKKSDTIKVTVAEPAEDAGILSSFELPQAYTLVQKTNDPAGTQSTDRDAHHQRQNGVRTLRQGRQRQLSRGGGEVSRDLRHQKGGRRQPARQQYVLLHRSRGRQDVQARHHALRGL